MVEHPVAVRLLQLAIVGELVEVLESRLVQPLESDGQPPGHGHPVKKAQVHRLRLFLPLVVHLVVGRDEPEVLVLLQDVPVPDVHRRPAVVLTDTGVGRLVCQRPSVRPNPFAA